MLYTGTKDEQVTTLLVALEAFAEGFTRDSREQVDDLHIDTLAVEAVIDAINKDFPYVNGVDKASAFKKAAYLIAHTVYMKPIVKVIFADELDNSYQFSHVLHDYDANAVFAIHLAIYLINSHKIERKDGAIIESMEEIALSKHSYTDILEALSTLHVSAREHYKLLALLLEQIFYKTNPYCQYPEFVFGPQHYVEGIVQHHDDNCAGSIYQFDPESEPTPA